MKQNVKNLLKLLCFFLTLFVIVFCVQGVFGVDREESYNRIHDFTKEKKQSLDCVFIGSSNVAAFWQPLFGWEQYGISSWDYSPSELRPIAIKSLIVEARKTQPNALYIICLNTFKAKSQKISIKNSHYLLDYFPPSLNKIELTGKLLNKSTFSFQEQLELYLPFIRFHSRWDSLDGWVFDASEYDFKSSLTLDLFLDTVQDVSERVKVFSPNEDKEPIKEDIKEALIEILDYCDENNVKVLFYRAPHANTEAEEYRMNGLEQYISERGYSCIDFLKTELLGLDLENDYYNKGHTNVHGSIKFTSYLGNYLVEQYGFTDKRGLPEWKDWDEAAKEYREYLSPYILPFETEGGMRINLPSPVPEEISASGQQIKIRWGKSEGAEGYEIYRKAESSDKWILVSETGGTEFTDEEPEKGITYTYRIVPFVIRDGIRYYGNFMVKGISGIAGTGGTGK